MFTVLCRQSTGAFLYVIRKSNIMSDMLTWKYIGVLSIKGKTQFQTVLPYTYCRNTYPKRKAIMKMYRVVPITKIVDE